MSGKTGKFGAVLGVVFLSSMSSMATEPTLERSPLPNCKRGAAVSVTLPFQDAGFRQHYDLAVFAGPTSKIEEVVGVIKTQGLKPVAVLNAGFHTGITDQPVSFFKSSFFGVEHPYNSARSPRACMVYDRTQARFEVIQSTPAEFERIKKLPDAEIFCAGPEVLRAGQNILKDQLCDEQFDPKCRADGSDPGLGPSANNPRSAACVTTRGELKLFSFSSPVNRCGATLAQMTRFLSFQDCESAINLDGGGSTKLFADLPELGKPVWELGNETSRKNPVWIVVFRR